MELKEFFTNNPKCAVAFSGGVDSSYLLYAAVKAGTDVKAYYIKTEFQPRFEYDDALRLSREIEVPMQVIEYSILSQRDVAENPADRCYHCKKALFTALMEAAEKDGYSLVLDGTNASDDANDRPGMRALAELGVRSPLRECGLKKNKIRRLSKDAGLFTWDKPAYACLATRVRTHNVITKELLTKIESAEALMAQMGFSDFRVRVYEDFALIQLKKNQFEKVTLMRDEILKGLKPYFNNIFLDMEAR